MKENMRLLAIEKFKYLEKKNSKIIMWYFSKGTKRRLCKVVKLFEIPFALTLSHIWIISILTRGNGCERNVTCTFIHI